MLSLPPAKLTFEEERKYYSEILDMCHQPAYKRGIKVKITQHSRLRIGLTGVVRPFNPVDYNHLYEEYSSAIRWGCKLPSMDCVFDFFAERLDKKGLSIFHDHISTKNFMSLIGNQLILKFSN